MLTVPSSESDVLHGFEFTVFSAIGQTDLFTQIYSMLNIFMGSVFPFTTLMAMNAVIASVILKRKKVSTSI